MIMTQTTAILYDAYRALRARKMFWIVLGLSGLVVVAFASLGIDEHGLKFFVWTVSSSPTTNDMTPAMLYKITFTSIALEFWLAWIATILALISTAGIFPAFISSGSISVVLAKPISRVRLFLTQYVAGLLFVVLQVFVFCLASFLLIGIRGGEWEPGIFLAVPLVVCFFSYLFSVCVFLGLVTRSTVAALLLTLLFWFLLYGLNTTDNALMVFQIQEKHRAARLEWKIQARRKAPVNPVGLPSSQPTTQPASWTPDDDATSLVKERQRALDSAEKLGKVQQIIYRIKTFLPKTAETVKLTERVLISTADLPGVNEGQGRRDSGDGFHGPDQSSVARELAERSRSRSVGWILGTSLAFEFVFLALSALIFHRRDF